jgi:hypothetical protein
VPCLEVNAARIFICRNNLPLVPKSQLRKRPYGNDEHSVIVAEYECVKKGVHRTHAHTHSTGFLIGSNLEEVMELENLGPEP